MPRLPSVDSGLAARDRSRGQFSSRQSASGKIARNFQIYGDDTAEPRSGLGMLIDLFNVVMTVCVPRPGMPSANSLAIPAARP
jgi:hypothetical protein